MFVSSEINFFDAGNKIKIKVWNLSKNNAGKRTNQLDIEPIINYRYDNFI